MEAAIDLQKYKQVSTNLPLKYYDGNIETSIKLGPQVIADKSAYNQVRAASSIFSIGGDWDAYDMGAPFSTDLIGYSYDITNPVGKYLYETYHVKSLLRETKKFETPYSAYDVEMGYQALNFNSNGSCGALYEHQLNAATVKERSKYIAKVAYAKAGYWVNGYNPSGKSSLPSESTIMRNLPLTLRFFQDGKMILHLESDANSNWVEVKYPYQNESY